MTLHFKFGDEDYLLEDLDGRPATEGSQRRVMTANSKKSKESKPSSTSSGRRAARLAAGTTWQDDDEEDKIRVKRVFEMSAEDEQADSDGYMLMGKVERHPITGRVYLSNTAPIRANCTYADLYERENLHESVQKLVRDKYLFRIHCLPHRSWIFHSIYRTTSADGTGAQTPGQGFWHALEFRCNDHEVQHGGEWSPALLHAPALFLAVVTADPAVCILGFFHLLWIILVDVMTNSAYRYAYARVFTWPVRMVYFIFLITRMAASEQLTAVLGSLGLVLVCLGDFILGDVQSLRAHRLKTYYEVLRVLPNQVVVCRKANDIRGYLHKEEITGWPNNDKDHWSVSHVVLVANVMGILAELIPISPDDEMAILSEARRTETSTLRSVGLDVFSATFGEDVYTLDPHHLTDALRTPVLKMDRRSMGQDYELVEGIRSYLAYRKVLHPEVHEKMMNEPAEGSSSEKNLASKQSAIERAMIKAAIEAAAARKAAKEQLLRVEEL